MSSTKNTVVNCSLDICPLPSRFICTGCHLVNYCSKYHQKADWKNHKKACSPLTLQTSTEFGRHYVASRNLKAGTLILSELPLLVEPLTTSFDEEFYNKCPQLMKDEQKLLNLMMSLSLNRQNEFYKRPQIMLEEHNLLLNIVSQGKGQGVCLACCTPSEGNKCPKCKWPMCSIECSKAKIHADNECPIFVKNSFKIDKIDQEILIGVFFIRGLLLKKSQPELWAKIQNLQSESLDKTIAEKDKESFSKIVSEFQEKFKKLEKDTGEDFVNLKELVKLYRIQRQNGLSSILEEKPGKKASARILYLKSSMFSHACFPNCSWSLTCGPVFKIEIITAVDIIKGQILTIAYSATDFMKGSMKRNLDGMKLGGFNCLCDRCLDPTELNSMMSAVKCTKEDSQDGYLIPKDPKNFSPSSIWACIKCGDQSTETWEGIDNLVKRAEKMTKKFTDFEPKKIEDLLIILRKHLHPNHWVIQQFCRQAIRKIENNLMYGDTEENVLNYFIEILRYIIQVSQLIMPGLSYHKAEFLQKLVQALRAKFHRVSSIDNGDQMNDVANENWKILDQLIKIKKLGPNSRKTNGQWSPVMMDLIGKRIELDFFLDLPISKIT